MVSKEWASINLAANSMERWQNKIRHIRSFLRGWARNLSSVYKKEKDKLLELIDELDTKAETAPLNNSDRDTLRDANEKLARLHRDEETKWAQRAKVKHVQEGGNNTKYFLLIANGKHRRKKIFQLEQDEGAIIGEETLKAYITEFYKKLFRAREQNFFSLNETEVGDIPQLSQQENEILLADFTEQQVYDAISQMEKNKAPGPDVFPAKFYQVFWETLKGDLMALFKDFQDGNLPLYHLNFGTIILLPKKEDAVQIQQYRPICLLNVSFKIFTKVRTSRVTKFAHLVLRPTQTAFMPGRHILEGVLVLHKTIHELHHKILDGVLIKINFEKAYDKVNWDFLQQAMRMKGFDSKWCKWVQEFVSRGSVGIRVNDDIG
jgi:hypothetical protein